MNYTTNYHLPQWVESDRVLMEDFNEAMESIDSNVKEASQPTYTVGNYTGNGESQTIELGFRPRFLIITAQSSGNIGATAFLGYIAFSAGTQASGVLSFGETGFTVTRMVQVYPATNDSGKSYSYIAFR